MRGLAVLLMIPSHTFNAFTRPELRGHPAYMLSQFFGGMAAPLFLFLAGVTFAFLMDRLDEAAEPALARIWKLAQRGGYILALAYLFRLSNAVVHLPSPDWDSLWKVDILNCMGAAILAFSLVSLWPAPTRAHLAAVTGLALASAAPLVSSLDWSGVPPAVKEYFVPNRMRFPLFPWSAYVAFGLAGGLALRRCRAEMLERMLQWGAWAGLAAALGVLHFSNLPYTLYPKSDFWTDSPALVFIRTGVILVIAGAAWLWTEHLARPGAGWMQIFGRTSLLVYWVHIILVYGLLWNLWGQKLSPAGSAAASAAVIVAMAALAHFRLKWKSKARAAGAHLLKHQEA